MKTVLYVKDLYEYVPMSRILYEQSSMRTVSIRKYDPIRTGLCVNRVLSYVQDLFECDPKQTGSYTNTVLSNVQNLYEYDPI